MADNVRNQFQKGLDLCFEAIGSAYNKHILIALSGGADSVALLRLFSEIASANRIRLSACHVNHGIRGDEADRDEAFCRALCEKRQIAFHSVQVDVPSVMVLEKSGMEETARKLRYTALCKTAAEQGCDLIATAHNADDHLETVLFHLARGSGARGMQGIAPVRNNIIRPLLFCTKQEILSYLTSLSQDFVTDSSNSDTAYTRNYIRKNLLPALKEINPEAARASLFMSLALREDEKFLDSLLPTDLPDRTVLCTLSDVLLLRLIRREYEKAGGKGLSREHCRALISLVKNGKTGQKLCLPCAVTAQLDRNRLSFRKTERSKAKTKTDAKKHPILRENDIVCSHTPHIYAVSYEKHPKKNSESEKVYNLAIKTEIDSAILDGELYWRHRLPGDTIRFGGMTRKIKKMLAEKGLSPAERDALPIVCDAKGPLWVPGFPVREDAQPQNGTPALLIFRR